ncbi:hypothetical protein [Bacillus toyonensis]|uniref:hypothetical protein n=1 Tax=Bacillus toyonensis TaxID=155322 RepID=UPI000BF17539|nr:hypothetical protein [Bacillus toyonensis]PEM38012.1 hypothetical protein CN636_30220 [Bacillus toyonensis]
MKKNALLNNNIGTDAASSIKGIALQKLRAVERLLNALLDDKKSIFCTIEHLDDVFEGSFEKDCFTIKPEQNKNFSTPFTINSNDIKKTLRIFFDTWRQIEEGENISFVFYTNSSFTSENKVGLIKELELELPDKPILELLINKNYEGALPIVIPIFTDFYLKQHKKHNEDITYFEQYLKNMTQDEWIKFLNLIEWKFNEPDEKQLRILLSETVNRLCVKFGVDLKYSKNILRSMLDLVEEQSLEKTFLDKIVHVAQIELMFREFANQAEVNEKLDPVHAKWDDISCEDRRDILEKVKSVCEKFPSFEFETLLDGATDGELEYRAFNVKEIKSYKYRVYRETLKHIRRIIHEKEGEQFSYCEIMGIFDNLTEKTYKHIEDKAKTYKIPFKDEDMVRKTILILFNECYLALDNK